MNNLAEFRPHNDPAAWAAPTATPPARPHQAPRPSAAAAVAVSRRKRAFDVMVALAALVVFLPLLLLIGLMVRLESPGPALFRQRRTGLNGRVFTVFKFRTMTVAEDGDTVRQATRGDARVTALGAILRKFSIDELPQFLNVLRGDMSLIGPRPHALAHDEAWSQAVPDYDRRFRARPGLTGYAAVCGFRGEVKELQAIVDRVNADNEYIDTWSFALDMRIVWRTLPLIFGDARAY
ncbi:sugar transferase [Phenylobacterium kunshanense]|uniref:Exopolysaccharide biosynthesis protein n=1 Tax=Phenylobacterium kunshanense TaxID=1445034 RepID=A0A328BKQ0_9CAUL|nr:sugar transferase [Phenylobacterium kunshanense]RAK66566.1 exopolysaccharide biosynthesis protein [Phenylobacterium kunshanense]